MECAEALHAVVAEGLFLCKRMRPDMQPTIAALRMRVKGSNEADCGKLASLMKHLKSTKEPRLILSAGDPCCIKWRVDASFAVHPDCKSHAAGATVSFEDGKGVARAVSRKQGLNAAKEQQRIRARWSQ